MILDIRWEMYSRDTNSPSQVPTKAGLEAAIDAERHHCRAIRRRRHHSPTGRREEGTREARGRPHGTHVPLRWRYVDLFIYYSCFLSSYQSSNNFFFTHSSSPFSHLLLTLPHLLLPHIKLVGGSIPSTTQRSPLLPQNAPLSPQSSIPHSPVLPL